MSSSPLVASSAMDPVLWDCLWEGNMVKWGYFRHHVDMSGWEAWCPMLCVYACAHSSTCSDSTTWASAVHLCFMDYREIGEVLDSVQSWIVITIFDLSCQCELLYLLCAIFFIWGDQGLEIKVLSGVCTSFLCFCHPINYRDIPCYIRFGFPDLFRCYQLCIKTK